MLRARFHALAASALLLPRLFVIDSVAFGQQAPAPVADVVATEASVAGRAPAVVVEPGATTAETPRAGMLDPAGVEAFVDGFMSAYLEENGAVGGVVSIVENGQIVLAKGYGEDDRARHRAVEARRTLFRVGSVSKLFVWTAVMQLVERGKVDLDADVNRYLEGVEVPATFKEPVTLAHLMTHTAGFEDHVLGLFAHDASRCGRCATCSPPSCRPASAPRASSPRTRTTGPLSRCWWSSRCRACRGWTTSRPRSWVRSA